MTINVDINPAEATKSEFAQITLRSEVFNVGSELDLEFTPLHDRCEIPDPVVLDFLFLASVVYGVDKLVSRDRTDDRWTRTFELALPVSDSQKWSIVKYDLENCLSFLTGDVWTIHFADHQHELYRPKQRMRPRRNIPPRAKANAVCLFSGGLDSLIGAIDYLESHMSDQLFLVGHHDRSRGPMSDQCRLYEVLKKNYKPRLDLLQVRVGAKPMRLGWEISRQETTLRSRSLLFIVLGIYAARSMGDRVPLLIPENGAIALNILLTPSRRGSCSTRTAHPFFLGTLRNILVKLGIENPLYNPLEGKTKGECVENCLNQTLLHSVAKDSVSCAKRGHNRTWKNRTALGCGRCVPCIYRRASLHKVGLDTETYGLDICTGDVGLKSRKVLADDFRALLTFLRREHSKQAIASLLLANGSLEVSQLSQYADVVARSMDEVRALLRDKGTDEIKRRAGLIS